MRVRGALIKNAFALQLESLTLALAVGLSRCGRAMVDCIGGRFFFFSDLIFY